VFFLPCLVAFGGGHVLLLDWIVDWITHDHWPLEPKNVYAKHIF